VSLIPERRTNARSMENIKQNQGLLVNWNRYLFLVSLT
jgi:hypothetical protein